MHEDYFYVKCSLDKPSKKSKKSDIVFNISASGVIQIKPHLTLRICLSLHAKAHDPLGLVLPTRMIGSLLFRNTLQQLKKDRQGKFLGMNLLRIQLLIRTGWSTLICCCSWKQSNLPDVSSQLVLTQTLTLT